MTRSMSPYFAVAQIENRIREPLKGLTDKEAVAHLVDQLKRERHQRVDRLGLLLVDYPTMTPVAANLFLTLWDHRGRLCTYTVMAERFSAWADYDVVPTTIQNHMKHLRRAVERNNIPVTIATHNGFGYSMSKNEPTWEPLWDKPTVELYV